MAGTSIHSSDPAYPAYLFSCWADSAQDPYKQPLSRAVRKRKEVASAVEQEPEVAHFDADRCISNAAVRIMGSLGNRIPRDCCFLRCCGWLWRHTRASRQAAQTELGESHPAARRTAPEKAGMDLGLHQHPDIGQRCEAFHSCAVRTGGRMRKPCEEAM